MRLDHLLSREKAKSESLELIPGRSLRKRSESEAETTRRADKVSEAWEHASESSGVKNDGGFTKTHSASKELLLESLRKGLTVSFSGFGSRTLTTAQRMIQSERPVANTENEQGRSGRASESGAWKGRSRSYEESNEQLVSGRSDEKIKLTRAQGGCQGTIRRRRTWQAAKSCGELQASIDPQTSEWGNPMEEDSITIH